MSRSTVADFSTPLSAPRVKREKVLDERLTPERLASANLVHDRILTALVLVFTFLLTSFPVSNSDALLHLKVGEMIARGEFTFGQDPFSYTVSNETVWVHHAWLFDLILYGMYSATGGAGLVVFRGLVALALALLFLKFRRPGSTLFPYVFATMLAMLLIAQRMFMRPEVISLLFVGLTAYWLWRPTRPGETPGRRRSWLYLPPLFALWVNLDHWFFLGPAMVGLYLLGEVLQDWFSEDAGREDKVESKDWGRLGLVFLIGVGACLLNPFFHRALLHLPGELWSPALTTFQALEPEYRFGVSPFTAEYFRETTYLFRPLGLTLAEWAYYPLVLLGAASFLAGGRLRWGRLLVWLAFFALSAYQARNAAFLAVVTVPVVILNLQERLATPSVERPWVALGQLARAGTLLLILLLGGLVVVAKDPTVQALGSDAPEGLVHGRGAPGWTLVENPSWKAACTQLARWRAQGKLPGNTFHLQLDAGNHLAWNDTGKTNFMDLRFPLFPDAAVQFVEAGQALRRTGTQRAYEFRWQDIFNQHDISHLVLSTGVVQEQSRPGLPQPPVALLLLLDVANWEQLAYNDGRTFILAWKKSKHWPNLRELRYDPVGEAFRRPTRLPPPEGPDLLKSPVDPLAALLGAPAPMPLAFQEANWHVIMHRLSLGFINGQRFAGIQGQAVEATLRQLAYAPAMALTGSPLPPLPFMESLPDARVVLAIRALRRSLAENPKDAQSHRLLFEAYQLLSQLEDPAFGDTPPVQNPIRELQTFFALKNWADLVADEPIRLSNERNANPHLLLAQRYFAANYLDLALEHYKRGVDAFRAAGNPPGMTDQEFQKSLANLDRFFFAGQPRDQLEDLLRQTQAQYRARVLDPQLRENYLARSQLALGINPRCRLANEAQRDFENAYRMTQAARVLAYPALMELTLDVGQFDQARALLNNPQAPVLLGQRYHQFAGLVAAAYGDYDMALQHLAEVDRNLTDDSVQRVLNGFKMQLLGGNPEPMTSVSLGALTQVHRGLSVAMQRSDSLAMMGLLAMEAGVVKEGQGKMPSAADLFRRAIEVFPESNFRAVAGHYYFLITGQLLE